MIHFESNYYNVKVEALKGAKLLNVESGNEIQRFSIGQIVKSTENSPICFNIGRITDFYQENGYYYYNVVYSPKYGLSQVRLFRQKDLVEA